MKNRRHAEAWIENPGLCGLVGDLRQHSLIAPSPFISINGVGAVLTPLVVLRHP
jgi:hypothetical protein